MPRTKLIIEANSRMLLLEGDVLRNKNLEDEYHFKMSVRTRDVKACASHTGAYCRRMKLACDGCNALQLPQYNISTLHLTGDNNELYIDCHAVLHYTKPANKKITITVSGKNNMLKIDTEQIFGMYGLPVRQMDICIKSTRTPASGTHRIILSGTIACLNVSLQDSGSVDLDAGYLIVTEKATVKCCTDGLLQRLIKPRLISSATWSLIVEEKQTPAVPPVAQPQQISPKSKTLLPAYSKYTSVIEWSAGQCLAACEICMTNVPNAACVPCGHMLCVQCAYRLCKNLKQDQLLLCPCSGCKQSVERVLHVIFNMEKTRSSSSSSKKRKVEAISIDE